ncbi:MAG: outer membrane protein assembly factor [Paludibacteraceae bacterium]|nr:outer membrane protein assembly factor [Paludibacteraceae bacterium]
MVRSHAKIIAFVLTLTLLSGCRYLRYVPEDQYLLKKVTVKSDKVFDDETNLLSYVHQSPNNYFMGIGRMKLAMYSASDTSKHTTWQNWLRKIGEPPVIYDSTKRADSEEELRKVMFNKGYLSTEVTSDTTIKNRQVSVTYHVKANKPHLIRHYVISLPDTGALNFVRMMSRKEKTPKLGDLLDADKLNAERERVAKHLRNNGYYNFTKELLFFAVDSSCGQNMVDVEMQLQPSFAENDSALAVIFSKPKITNVTIMSLNDNQYDNIRNLHLDTMRYKDFIFVCNKEDNKFRPKAIIEKICFNPGDIYRDFLVTRTYDLLNSMPAVKYVNIIFSPADGGNLKCFIIVSPNKPHTLDAQLDLTYSDDEIGVMPGLGYSNNNIFHGSEILKVNVKGGWEGVGKISQMLNTWKIGENISLTFPKLLLPIKDENRRMKVGQTEIALSSNHEDKRDYERTIFSGAFKYHWTRRRIQYSWSVLDLSFIKMGDISDEFAAKYLIPESSVRFSYEDNFIMRMGMTIGYTNRRNQQSDMTYFTIRAGVKIAGNLIYGISNMVRQKKNSDGQYEIFGIPYSQFTKVDFDYAHNIRLHDNVRLVCHAGLGVAVPYGNSTIMPYEERYFSGGANSTRGWASRSLGPGFYDLIDKHDFMNQSGDVKLDLNMELRARAFWKLEFAAFLDAGNIWTIKDYEQQPGGAFRFDQFYKQLGVDYGFGIRLNFDFLVVRLDLGVKIYDPSRHEDERVRSNPKWSEDCALHFAIGYPF